MNGVHDLGGMHGLGPIQIEDDEPVFHAEWEKIVFALNIARPRYTYNVDEFRHGIENMDPVHYLAARYYERWLFTAVYNLLKKSFITREEYDARTLWFKRNRRAPLPRRNDPKRAMEILQLVQDGRSTRRKLSRDPKFKVGERVLARNMNPTGHTRLPRYVRKKSGIIMKVHGIFVLPDMNAHGKGENPEHVYNVRFNAKDLWGDADGREAVHVDLWESYLQRT